MVYNYGVCAYMLEFIIIHILGSITANSYSNYNNYNEQSWHHIIHINCNGTESSLLECASNPQINTCNRQNYDAAVSCSGDYMYDSVLNNSTGVVVTTNKTASMKVWYSY